MMCEKMLCLWVAFGLYGLFVLFRPQNVFPFSLPPPLLYSRFSLQECEWKSIFGALRSFLRVAEGVLCVAGLVLFRFLLACSC